MQENDELTARERILTAAIRAIDDGGEASLRIVEVAREAGVSQGMIRYCFGDRGRLVAEAMGERFRTRYGFMLAEYTAMAEECTTQDEFRALTIWVMGDLFTPARSRFRLERNSDIGKAIDEPLLAEKIAEARDDLCRGLAAVFESARVRGVVRADADPIRAAGFYLLFAHGISLWELGPEFLPHKVLVEDSQVGLFALLFD